MSDLEALFHTIDKLPPEDFKHLYDYNMQRRRVVEWWVVPPENLEKIAEVLSRPSLRLKVKTLGDYPFTTGITED